MRCGPRHTRVDPLLGAPRGDGVGGQPPVVEQVPDIHVAEEDERVSQKASMTAPPHAFGAHHHHSVGRSQFDQRIEAGPELLCGHVIGIGPERLVAQRDMWAIQDEGAAGRRAVDPTSRRCPLQAATARVDPGGTGGSAGYAGKLRMSTTCATPAPVSSPARADADRVPWPTLEITVLVRRTQSSPPSCHGDDPVTSAAGSRPARLDAHLIGRLGHAGRTVDDTPVVEAEHALVPGALDRAVLRRRCPPLREGPRRGCSGSRWRRSARSNDKAARWRRRPANHAGLPSVNSLSAMTAVHSSGWC